VLADNPDLVTVVGIGAGGWADLAGTPRQALTSARVVFGSARQLDLLPAEVTADAVRDAATRLLTDPAFSTRAGDLRDELRAMPHPDDLVPMIEQLAAGGTA
jgi:hypothetical protein